MTRDQDRLIHVQTCLVNQLTTCLKEYYPVALFPQALASVSFTALQEIRGGARSLSDAKLLELQSLAAQSIGVKDVARLEAFWLNART